MTERQASPTDAQLIMQLYDLRREPEMRKARNFMVEEFWPESFDDIVNLARAFGTDQNKWMRQVIGYWEMACTFVARGALDPGMFFDVSQEGWAVYVRIRPFLRQARETFNAPDFMLNMERVMEGTEQARERVARMEESMMRFRDLRKQQAK